MPPRYLDLAFRENESNILGEIGEREKEKEKKREREMKNNGEERYFYLKKKKFLRGRVPRD